MQDKKGERSSEEMERRFFRISCIFFAGMDVFRNVPVLVDIWILKKSAYISRSANLKHSIKLTNLIIGRKGGKVKWQNITYSAKEGENMSEVKLIQLKNREEWLQNRTRIGGSDAAAILGMNPYKTNVELWQEKTGQRVPEDISEKPYVKYGTEAERPLRELFAIGFPEYKVDYVENNMFLNTKCPFAHASLDGWLTDSNGRKGVLEIKTTNILQSTQKEKWNGKIPDNYYIQLLHNLYVTEFEFAVLKAELRFNYNNDVFFNTKHYFVERSEVEDDIQYLAEQEGKFWRYVVEGKEPPLVLPQI